MAKQLSYFRFHTAAYRTGKIQLCTMQEQGVFINLCALILDNGGAYRPDRFTARQLRIDEQTFNGCLQTLTDVGLVVDNGGDLSVKFITEQINEYADFCAKNSRAGRASARARQQAPTNKRKGKDKKGKDNNKGEDAPGGAPAASAAAPLDCKDLGKLGPAGKSYVDMVKRVYRKQPPPINVVVAELGRLRSQGISAERVAAVCDATDVIANHFRALDTPRNFTADFSELELKLSARNNGKRKPPPSVMKPEPSPTAEELAERKARQERDEKELDDAWHWVTSNHESDFFQWLGDKDSFALHTARGSHAQKVEALAFKQARGGTK
jgi:hypothetical protein